MTQPSTHHDEQYDFRLGYLLCISLVSALGGLLFGYDLLVLSGAKQFYEELFQIAGKDSDSTLLQGWAASSCVIGCIIGALGVGKPCDRFGRVAILKLSALLFLASALWTSVAPDLTQFALARIVGGLGMGMAATVSPMYIAEVSPARLRGRFVSLNQLTIVLGILAAQAVNYLILTSHPLPIDPQTGKEVADAALLDTWNGRIGWRAMFGVEAIPALLLFVCAFFIPRSPRWLVKRGLEDKAAAVLTRLGGPRYASDALAEIETTLSEGHREAGLAELLKPRMKRIMAIGVFLAVFQQWCGINVIFVYAADLFEAAGYSVTDIFLQLVVIGTTNLVCTFLGMALVDSLGRKPLLVAGSIGLAITYTCIGVAYYFDFSGLAVVVFAIASCGVFAATLGPVVWVVISELFPNRIRGVAVSFAVASLWAANFVLIVSFPRLKAALGPAGCFAVYAVVCLCGVVYIVCKVPETKSKSLEELEHELCDNHSIG
ncbi:MAG: sugar porter family MFS transporter [Candidatus Nealsonbacteria bacterium]|nr:sugar porter family MFS transporter [Candidatus Nealsonbacteria bacterium]